MLIGWLSSKSEALQLTKKEKFPISSDSGLSKNKLPDVSNILPWREKNFTLLSLKLVVVQLLLFPWLLSIKSNNPIPATSLKDHFWQWNWNSTAGIQKVYRFFQITGILAPILLKVYSLLKASLLSPVETSWYHFKTLQGNRTALKVAHKGPPKGRALNWLTF